MPRPRGWSDSILVGTRPRDAQFTRDGAQLWVSSETRATVAILDMASRKILRTIDFDEDPNAPDTVQAVGIALAPAGDKAYVALGRGNAVAEIDAHSYAVLTLLRRRIPRLGRGTECDRVVASTRPMACRPT